MTDVDRVLLGDQPDAPTFVSAETGCEIVQAGHLVIFNPEEEVALLRLLLQRNPIDAVTKLGNIARGLPEQVYQLGERVEFLDASDPRWYEGTVCEATLMGDGDRIAYGCYADSGFSLRHLEPECIRPPSVVKQLGKIADV